MLPKPRKFIPGVLASQYQKQTYGVMTLSKLSTGCQVKIVTLTPLPQQYHCFAVDSYRITTGSKPKGRTVKVKSFEQEQLDNLNGATWG